MSEQKKMTAGVIRHSATWQSIVLALAGPAISVLVIGLVALIYWDPIQVWPKDAYQARLQAVTWTLFIYAGLQGFALLIAGAGAVRSLDLSLGILKAKIDLDDDDSTSPSPDVQDTSGS